MESAIPILVIHRDRERAAEITAVLQKSGQFKVKCIFGGMDGVPTFAWFKPSGVIIEFGLADLPVPALVDAFRQMKDDVKILLCSDQPSARLERDVATLKVLGSFTFPIDEARLMQMLTGNGEGGVQKVVLAPAVNLDDSMDQTLRQPLGENAWKEAAPQEAVRLRVTAEEINRRGTYRHVGTLEVVGNLEGVSKLEVLGPMIVHGNIADSVVRCNGPLIIEGQIIKCSGGVFCRGDIEVRQIFDSLVVCGTNLWLLGMCRGSQVNVVQRLVGKGKSSSLVGGQTRVGEHISVGALGDDNHTMTHVNLAADLFRDIWIRRKQRQWDFAVAGNEKLKSAKSETFEKQLVNPQFYQLQAELLAQAIYPCISVKIGDKEDYFFDAHAEPIRIALGRKSKTRFGVVLRTRSQSLASNKAKARVKKTAFKIQSI